MNSLAVLSLALLATLYVTCLVDVTVAYDDKNSDDDGAVEIPPNYWSQQLAELTELVKLGEQALAEKLAKEMRASKRGRGTACFGFSGCAAMGHSRKFFNSKQGSDDTRFGPESPGRKRRTTETVSDPQA
ncbi:uncharacterized protein LOC144448357 isoform X1 [Glandiceps talaboti]